MNEVLTITDPGWDWTPLTVFAIIIVSLLVLAGVFSVLARRVDPSGIRKLSANLYGFSLVFVVVAGFAGFLGLFAVPLDGARNYDQSVNDAMVVQLAELGYADAALASDGTFTANRDGAYFRGALISTGDLTWEIVEVNGGS